jgi:RHS repeat-associated protein
VLAVALLIAFLQPTSPLAAQGTGAGGGGNGGGPGGGVTPYIVSPFSLTHTGGGTVSVQVNATNTTTFTAQNLGGSTVTASFVVTACSGALKPGSCSVSPTSKSLAPNQTWTVTATFIGGAAAGSGTLTVAAKNGSTTLATSSVAVTVTPLPNAPTVSTSPHRGDALDVSQCVADCFETTLAESSPTYISLDQPRSVTVLYRSGRANPYGRLQLGAIDGNASVTSFRLQLTDPFGANVTFTNGATSLFFARKTSDTTRLAAQFDASAIPTSARLYTAAVTSFAGGTQLGTTYTPVRIIVINDRASPLGAGVDFVGFQRLFTSQTDGVLITDGSGSASFFTGTCVPAVACAFTSPKGDFSQLTTGNSKYTRTFPDGSVVTFDVNGRQLSAKSRFGDSTYVTWGTTTQGVPVPTGFMDAVGAYTQIRFRTPADTYGVWKDGSFAGILTPLGEDFSIGVNAANDLQTWADIDNSAKWRATYDAQHRVTQVLDKAGGVWTHTYSYGATLDSTLAPSVKLANSGTARPLVLVRDMYSGLYLAAAQGHGKTTSDIIPVPTFDIRAAINDPLGYGTYFTLSRFGSPTAVYASLTNPAYATYDTLTGQLTRSVAPTGAVQRLSWVNDQLRQTIDSSGGTARTVNIDYETSYSLPTHVYGSVAEQLFTYDHTKAGWPLKTSKVGSSSALPTTYAFDAYGRPTSVVDPSGHTTTYAYETTGLRNHSSVTAPNTQSTTFAHDAWGRDTLVRDPKQFTWRQGYDVLHRVAWTLSPLVGDTTKFQYDSLDNITKVTNAKGQTYTTVRNALGWVVKQIDPAGRVDSAAYDSAGRVVYTKSRQQREVKLQYDALGRVTQQIGVAKHDTNTFVYDPGHRWVAAQAVSRGTFVSTDTIFTDSLGRTIKEQTVRPGTGSAWYVTSYYNPSDPGRGNVSVYKNGMPYTETEMGYGYDTSKRLSIMGSVYAGQTTFGYDAEQLLSSITRPSGTSFANLVESIEHTSSHDLSKRSFNATNVQSAMARSYKFDSLTRLTQRGSGTAGKFQNFYYDAKGRFYLWEKKAKTSGQCVNLDGYGYDCSGTTSTLESVLGTSYDNVENNTDLGSVVTTGNRLMQYHGFSMTYDLDGNMVKRVGATTDSLDWDDFGQLRAVMRGGTTIASFSYDGFGRRVKKVTPTSTIQYVWDGDQLMLEADASGAQIRSYAYFPGTDQLHSVRSGGQVYYAAIEPSGDVDGLIRRSDTTVVAQYAYTPWGEVESEQQTVAGGPLNMLRWKGLLYDSDIGMYYVRARYYDPKLRRFISEDPIGLAGGINAFAFAGGDPINVSDPSGLDPCTAEQYDHGWRDVQVGVEGGPDSKTECMSPAGAPPIVITGQAPGFWDSFLSNLWNSEEILSTQNVDEVPGNHVVVASIIPIGSPGGFGGGSRAAARLTTSQAEDLAEWLGYTKRVKDAPFFSKGQAVFTNGKNFITQDIDMHKIEATWKMFDRYGKRVGTYTYDLLTRLGK